MKICTRCDKNKAENEFRLALKRGKYCLRAQCICCEKRYRKKYRIKNREKCLKLTQNWRGQNEEYIKEYSKIYETKNKEKRYAKNKLWYKNNPDRAREKTRLRTAQKKSVNECFTVQDELYVKNIFNNKCFNCNSSENLEIDHNRPLSLGYPLTKRNAVLLCKSCNCSKGAKMPEEFYDNRKLNKLNKIWKGE